MLWKTKVAALVLLAMAAVLAVGTQPAAAAANNTGTFAYLNSANVVPYGTDVPVHVETQDDSQSCQTIFDDCDNPSGTIVIYNMNEDGTGVELARGTLAPVHNNNEVSFVDILLEDLPPGFYRLLMQYFPDTSFWQSSRYGQIGLTVTKLDCGITLSQDSAQTVQGQQVEFLAAFNPPVAAGTVTFRDQNNAVLGTTSSIFLGIGAKLQTTTLPIGTTQVTATYESANYNPCTSNPVSHVVSAPQPPFADAGGPYRTNEGTAITLDGRNSSGGTGIGSDTLNYQWDLDFDGFYDDAFGATPTFGARGDGFQFISLNVINGRGQMDTGTSWVDVVNVAPTVSPTIGGTRNEGSLLTLGGTVSDVWDPVTATVDWGDGTAVANALGSGGALTGTHTYADNGVYTVRVCGTDDDTSTCVDNVVAIANVAPTLGVSPATVAIDEGGVASLGVTIGDAGTGDTHLVEVDWGTGAGFQPVAPGTIQHTYGDNGSFTATVRVTDDDGSSAQKTALVTVANVAPSVVVDDSGVVDSAGGRVVIAPRGTSAGLAARVLDPGSDDLVATWDLGLGAPGVDETQTSRVDPAVADPFPSPSVAPRDHLFATSTTFDTSCLYRASVTVSDDDGGSAATEPLTVLVQGPAGTPLGTRQWASALGVASSSSAVSDAQLSCYLAGVRYVSSPFGGSVALDTREQAISILRPASSNARKQLLASLLAGWLDVASGAWDPGDAVAGSPSTVLTMLQAAEAALADPNAPGSTLTQHAELIDRAIRVAASAG